MAAAKQQEKVAALVGPSMVPFESLVTSLMSSNDHRRQAEDLFNLVKQTDPDALAVKLATLLRSSPDPESRAMAAVLLRKVLTRDDAYLWIRLSPPVQFFVKTQLFACLHYEPSESILKKLCCTVSELAAGILPDGAWPELLPFMFDCASSDWDRIQELAFIVFGQLFQSIPDALLPFVKELHSAFLHALRNSPGFNVRIAALNAVINFIQCLSPSTDMDSFQDLLPLMMRTLTEALNNGKEATAHESLELLIGLAGTEPRFLRHQLVYIVGSMLQVAEADSLEEGTRHLAIEFVITLAKAGEEKPEMMRKLPPQIISRLFAIMMRMLLDIDDKPAWHSTEIEDEDAGETSNYSFGQECLARLAISLGGNTIVPVVSEQLPPFLAAPEWQKHHAALIALAQVAEGCSEVMIKNLELVVSMVLNAFRDPHPRVRCAAINGIGQFATVLCPDLQNQFHQSVLPALAASMDDFENPRVQAHAASAVMNFNENCKPQILIPYLDVIVRKLCVLIKCGGKQMVKEGALTAIASVSDSFDSSEELFRRYCDAMMRYELSITFGHLQL